MVTVPRVKLGLTLDTRTKGITSSNFNPNVKIKINVIRWWEDYYAKATVMNMFLGVDKATLTPTLEKGFNVYKTSAYDSAVIYLPTSKSPDVFIYCHALYFRPKIEPYKNRCQISSDVNNLLHIEYMVYREDIPYIHDIHKSVSNFVGSLYKREANKASNATL